MGTDLGHECILEVGQVDPDVWVMRLAQEEVPQAELPCLALERLDHLRVVCPAPRGVRGHLGVEDSLGGHALLLHKDDELGKEVLGVRPDFVLDERPG